MLIKNTFEKIDWFRINFIVIIAASTILYGFCFWYYITEDMRFNIKINFSELLPLGIIIPSIYLYFNRKTVVKENITAFVSKKEWETESFPFLFTEINDPDLLLMNDDIIEVEVSLRNIKTISRRPINGVINSYLIN